MSAAIETERLTKRYGQHRGLDELDLLVRPGEVFGYLGPNGAGKTTTIRLLLDVIRPTGGHVRVLGLDPRADGVQLRRRVGYAQSELAFEGHETAGELLSFLAEARGGVKRERIDEFAQRLDVDLSRRILKMSTGNKRKVALVQAFMHRPEVLILDEPTSGLDPLVQQEFLAMVREARTLGQTVFMSSHVLSEVQHTADRVGIIREGRMVAVEEVETLRQRSRRRLQVRFAAPLAPITVEAMASLPNVRNLSTDEDRTVLRCLVDGSPDALLKAVARERVTDLVSTEPDLEEIFLTYYAEEGRP